MRKELIAGVVAAAALWPAMSLAQSPAQDGYREGYVLGFITGHPRTYDRVEEEIVVDRPLPRTVHVYEIPSHREYVYAYVNDRRVLVDARSRRIVKIIE
jgi:hypothetical protein